MSENLTQTHTEYGVRFPDGHIEGGYLDRSKVPVYDGCTIVERHEYRGEWQG